MTERLEAAGPMTRLPGLGATGIGVAGEAMRIGRSFAASRHAKEASKSGSQTSIVTAIARAEADAVPTAEDGAVVHSASVDLDVGTHVVWPMLVRIEHLASWFAGLEHAATLEGRGSSRVDEFRYANGYRVVRRVTRLSPEQAIVWRDVDEWIQDVVVPEWHAGSWTELRVERLSGSRCRVTMSVTQLARDAHQRERIDERAPAQAAWVHASITQLAARIAPA
jgi:uncharacterized protein YndB with AHSA1/START domain